MLSRFREIISKEVSFGFETTLAGKTYYPLLLEAKNLGYRIQIYFLWIHSADLAIRRIADRVYEGGHHVPSDAVRRRYNSGIYNFIHEYSELANGWILFDNSKKIPKLIAKREDQTIEIKDQSIYNKFMKSGKKK